MAKELPQTSSNEFIRWGCAPLITLKINYTVDIWTLIIRECLHGMVICFNISVAHSLQIYCYKICLKINRIMDNSKRTGPVVNCGHHLGLEDPFDITFKCMSQVISLQLARFDMAVIK